MIYEFGKRLKIERIRKNLSQQNVASLVGVEKSTVSSYESGGITPSPEVLLKLAQVFNVTVDFLLGNDDIKTLVVTDLDDGQVAAVSHVIDEFKRMNKLDEK